MTISQTTKKNDWKKKKGKLSGRKSCPRKKLVVSSRAGHAKGSPGGGDPQVTISPEGRRKESEGGNKNSAPAREALRSGIGESPPPDYNGEVAIEKKFKVLQGTRKKEKCRTLFFPEETYQGLKGSAKKREKEMRPLKAVTNASGRGHERATGRFL